MWLVPILINVDTVTGDVDIGSYCHVFSVTVDGVLDCQLDLLDPDTITVTDYHNVLPLQQFNRTQHKAGNDSSACLPLQQSSGLSCHQFLNSSSNTQTPTNELSRSPFSIMISVFSIMLSR
jgi:hypothetical protein